MDQASSLSGLGFELLGIFFNVSIGANLEKKSAEFSRPLI
jgi:hypothetical protein